MDNTKILMTNGSLMKVKSIAECSPWSILLYFWPELSNNWSWKPICCLFQNYRFTQVLLYSKSMVKLEKTHLGTREVMQKNRQFWSVLNDIENI